MLVTACINSCHRKIWNHFKSPSTTIRSIVDLILRAPHSALDHVENMNGYVRLFIDYSLVFNNFVSSKLPVKLRDWISACPSAMGSLTSSPADLNQHKRTSRLQAVSCFTLSVLYSKLSVLYSLLSVLYPLLSECFTLYSLYTHDGVARHSSNTIVTLANNITMATMS